MTTKHPLGQYFTTNPDLKQKVFQFIMNDPEIILEPSVGQGDLIQMVYNNNTNIIFDMYEIDTNITMLQDIPNNVIYGDFIEQKIKKKYKTIIGNPPFVKTSKGNLYIDFIKKCYDLLEYNGELIFIIPSDFFKLTSASKLINIMMTNGTFTHIYHPHKENLFKHAHIDVIVYRYCKNNELIKKILYNDIPLYIINNDGLITFDKNINEYLISHKDKLISRKIKKFNEKNWFEWGAPRNIKSIRKNAGKECIYLYNLTRDKKVAFKDGVKYFGGGLIILIPKDNINLDKITTYLNSDVFKKNFIFSGRFKIGHRQISNSYIPNECL